MSGERRDAPRAVRRRRLAALGAGLIGALSAAAWALGAEAAVPSAASEVPSLLGTSPRDGCARRLPEVSDEPQEGQVVAGVACPPEPAGEQASTSPAAEPLVAETMPPRPSARKPRPERAELLAARLHWRADDARIADLADWLDAGDARRGADLVARFGRADAAVIAQDVPLFLRDPLRGTLLPMDLDGFPRTPAAAGEATER
jgi:hypothetical protein